MGIDFRAIASIACCMQIPPITGAVGKGIAVLGVVCLLQLAPSYATPGYDFEAAKNSK